MFTKFVIYPYFEVLSTMIFIKIGASNLQINHTITVTNYVKILTKNYPKEIK